MTEKKRTYGDIFRRALDPFMAGSLGEALLLPLLAIITALIVGAIFIALTVPVVLEALGNFFNAPLAAVAAVSIQESPVRPAVVRFNCQDTEHELPALLRQSNAPAF